MKGAIGPRAKGAQGGWACAKSQEYNKKKRVNFGSACFSCKIKNINGAGEASQEGSTVVVVCIGARACYWQFTGTAEGAIGTS